MKNLAHGSYRFTRIFKFWQAIKILKGEVLQKAFVMVGLLVFGLIMLLPLNLSASGILINSTREPERIDVIAGKTVIIKSRELINRVYVADSNVATAEVFSPSEIVLTGKTPGSTTMTIWQNKKKPRSMWSGSN